MRFTRENVSSTTDSVAILVNPESIDASEHGQSDGYRAHEPPFRNAATKRVTQEDSCRKIRLSTVVLVASCLMTTACDSMEAAGALECTALYDHVVDVHMRDATGKKGKPDPGATAQDPADEAIEALGGAIVNVVGRAALDALGEKDKFITRCRTTKKKFEVRACMKTGSVAKLKNDRCLQ
mgnify:CR=1 FL=1